MPGKSALGTRLVYKQISQVGTPYHPGQLTSFADVLRHACILCNGTKFEIMLKFSMENTLNSRRKGKYYHCRQKITSYYSDIYN